MIKLEKEAAVFPHYTFVTGKITKIYPLDKVTINDEVVSRLRIEIITKANDTIECTAYRDYAKAIRKYLHIGRVVETDATLIIKASAKNPGEIEYLYHGTKIMLK